MCTRIFSEAYYFSKNYEQWLAEWEKAATINNDPEDLALQRRRRRSTRNRVRRQR